MLRRIALFIGITLVVILLLLMLATRAVFGEVISRGDVNSRWFVLWLAVSAVVFAAVVLLVIQRTVLSRILQLSAAVLAISTGNGHGGRVTVKGRDQIASLASAINGMLEALRESELRTMAFLDAIPDLILRVTRSGEIVDVRLPPRSSFVISPDGLPGAIADLATRFPYVPQKLVTAARDAIRQAVDAGLPVVLEFSLDPGTGAQHYQARIVASGQSEAIALVRDVTAEKRMEEAERRDTLVKEIHHRVKNNLQVISSLLGLQASSAGDSRARTMLEESRNRVRSMALIHDRLYHTGERPGGGYCEYVRDLAEHLLHSYMGESAAVTIGIEMDDVPMHVDQSVPIGLIINELLSNALGHAFPSGRSGLIAVGLRRVGGGMVELSVRDDGVGFPREVDYRNPSSLGLRIVNMLVQQVRGTLVLDARQGTAFALTFPET